jgi:hypothetical protein
MAHTSSRADRYATFLSIIGRSQSLFTSDLAQHGPARMQPFARGGSW